MHASSCEEPVLGALFHNDGQWICREHLDLLLEAAALALDVEFENHENLNFDAPAILEAKILQRAHFASQLVAWLECWRLFGLVRISRLLTRVEVEAALADVSDAHLFKYRPLDILQPVFWRHRHEPIKRSFTLIIYSLHRIIALQTALLFCLSINLLKSVILLRVLILFLSFLFKRLLVFFGLFHELSLSPVDDLFFNDFLLSDRFRFLDSVITFSLCQLLHWLLGLLAHLD